MWINLLILLLLTTSCTSQEEGEKLTIALAIEPIALTPYDSNDIPSYKVRWQIYDRLVSTAENGDIISELATSWTNIDPLTLEISIKTNILFHNNKPFTIEDAVYSVNQAVTSPLLSTVLGAIESAEIVDQDTMRIHLSAPYAPALTLLAHSGALMTSEEFQTEELRDQQIGTGPFKLVEWNRGQNILLAKNENYWGKTPEVDIVDFRVVPDASVRSIIVETGEVDVAYDIDGSDRERLQDSSEVVYQEAVLPTVHYLGFDLNKPHYQNMLFRQAIATAIDYQGIIDTVAFGAGAHAQSLLQGSIFGADTNLPKRERNLSKAKDLLVQSGVSTSTKLYIYAIEGPRKKMAEIIQANLKEIGLDTEIRVLEWGTMLDYARKGNLDMFLLGWTTIPADADIGLYSLVHSSTKGSGGNYSFYDNKQIDQLLEQARAEQNREKRAQIYYEIQQILYTELPLIPLYHPYQNLVRSKDIKTFEIDLFSVHRLERVQY